jgi:hypothetical protein
MINHMIKKQDDVVLRQICKIVSSDIEKINFQLSPKTKRKLITRSIEESLVETFILSILYDWSIALDLKIISDTTLDYSISSLKESYDILRDWLTPSDFLRLSIYLGQHIDKWIEMAEDAELYEVAANFLKINERL